MQAELFLLYLSIFVNVACSSSKSNKATSKAPKNEIQPRNPKIEEQPANALLPPSPFVPGLQPQLPELPLTVPPIFGRLKAIIIKTGPTGFEKGPVHGTIDEKGEILITICDKYRETDNCCSTTRLNNPLTDDFKPNTKATFKDEKSLYNCGWRFNPQFEVQLTPQLPKIELHFQRDKKQSTNKVRWSVDQVIFKFDTVQLKCDDLKDFGTFGPDPRTIQLTKHVCELTPKPPK